MIGAIDGKIHAPLNKVENNSGIKDNENQESSASWERQQKKEKVNPKTKDQNTSSTHNEEPIDNIIYFEEAKRSIENQKKSTPLKIEDGVKSYESLQKDQLQGILINKVQD